MASSWNESRPRKKRKRSIPWSRKELEELSELSMVYENDYTKIFQNGDFREGRTEDEVRYKSIKLGLNQDVVLENKLAKERRSQEVVLRKTVETLKSELALLQRKAGILDEVVSNIKAIASNSQQTKCSVIDTLIAVCPRKSLDRKTMVEKFGIPAKYFGYHYISRNQLLKFVQKVE